MAPRCQGILYSLLAEAKLVGGFAYVQTLDADEIYGLALRGGQRGNSCHHFTPEFFCLYRGREAGVGQHGVVELAM